MPVRRSARLRGLQKPTEDAPTSPATAINNNNDHNKTNNHKLLDPVMESEESSVMNTPAKPQADPATATVTHTPKTTSNQQKSPAKTPTSVFTRPTHQEMHPSKFYQSTTKQADSGLILGFNPIKKDAQGNVVKENPVQDTPTKVKASSPASTCYGTPGFEFKFSCHESQLSEEAKKLMESVREDVARIKAQLVHDKETNPEYSATQNGDRKIAQPRGKARRFSDAHMAEFKKMDSIAGHASAFRANPERFQPTQKTLKRTKSKANLDEPESSKSPAKEDTIVSPASCIPSAKRVKHDAQNNIFSGSSVATKLTQPRPRPAYRSSLMTPTRASSARASSVSLKPPRSTMIPSLARSPVTQSVDAPRTPRTDFNPRLKSNIPTLGNLKSILRRHQPLFSMNPSKIAAGTHLAAPDFTSDLLLGGSRETSQEPAPTPSPKKRVEFTPIAGLRDSEGLASPSPSKVPRAASLLTTSDVVYPTLPSLTPEKGHLSKLIGNEAATPSTIRQIRPSEAAATVPEIPGALHGISHKKRHRATDDETDVENMPPTKNVSDERSAKRLKLSSQADPKVTNASPLKARLHTPGRATSGPGRLGTPASARSKARGALSISRLNMLAQPKRRA